MLTSMVTRTVRSDLGLLYAVGVESTFFVFVTLPITPAAWQNIIQESPSVGPHCHPWDNSSVPVPTSVFGSLACQV